MHRLLLPRLGQTMEEGRLDSWCVAPGGPFSVGDVLYEIETEKVTAGVEATVPGRLVRVLVDVDSAVEVGALLAVIADPGEDPTEADIDSFVGQGGPVATAAPATPNSPSSAHSAEMPAPAATRPPATASPAPLVDRDGPVRAMPRTRALARSLGVDLSTLQGTGPEGIVLESDVMAAASPPPDDDILERRPLSSVHRQMARTLSRSWTEVPQFTQTIDVDVSGWRRTRDAWQANSDVRLTFTDLVLDAIVRAATLVPDVNSRFAEDSLILFREVSVALAVDTPHGLVVPVLKDLRELSVAGRARRRE